MSSAILPRLASHTLSNCDRRIKKSKQMQQWSRYSTYIINVVSLILHSDYNDNNFLKTIRFDRIINFFRKITP